MDEKINLFWKSFFFIFGIVIFCIIISVISYLCGYYSKKSEGIYPPTAPGVEYAIEQFRGRIEQQAAIIQSAIAESDEIRADYNLTKQHLEQARERIAGLTSLNQQAAAEIQNANAILEKIRTTNSTTTTIIIRLREINKEIEQEIDNLPDCSGD